jgi:hypothetical protein
MTKRKNTPASWQRNLMVGDASLSRMLVEWVQDKREKRKMRKRESKGRWARE